MQFAKTLFCLFILTGCELTPKAQKQTVFAADLKAAIDPNASGQVAVQRKRAFLIRNTIAKALSLDPNGMCLELGKMPCADLVHLVGLGGVSAYKNAQYQFPEEISITSPISFDRLVLSACAQRAGSDFNNVSNAVIFKDIELTIDRRLIDNEAIDKAIKRLYQRALMRNPTKKEIADLRQLHRQISDEEPNGAALNWMILSCYSVLGSVEAAFY